MSRIATAAVPWLRGLMVISLVGCFASMAFDKLGAGWLFFPSLAALVAGLVLNAFLAPQAARYLGCGDRECGWEGNLRDLDYCRGQCPRCEGWQFRYGVRLGIAGTRFEDNYLANTRTTIETWNIAVRVGTFVQIDAERSGIWTKDGWLSW